MSDFIEFDGNAETLEPLFGKNLAMRATLVLRGEECYLAVNSENSLSSERIEIFCPGLEKRLELIVPMWVGGPAAYLDAVEISGKLDRATTRSRLASISSISRLVLFREDETYEIV